MLERFTPEAREAVHGARDEAGELRQPLADSPHLLLALLRPGAGAAYDVLHAAGLDYDTARAEVERLVGTPEPLLDADDAAALRTVGIDLDAVRAMLAEYFGDDALDPEPPEPPRSRRPLRHRRQQGGRPSRYTREARKVLELAVREAVHRGDRQIGGEHLLLGLIRAGHDTAAAVLTSTGASLDDLRAATLARLGKAA